MPFPNKETQFKKGNPGGPGRPSKLQRITNALRELIDEKSADRALAAVWLKQALAADPVFFKELLNRLEGKVPDVFKNDDGDSPKPRIKPRKRSRSRRAGGNPAGGGAGGGDAPG